MNKNPERPKNIDKIISNLLNPKKKKQKSKYWETQEKILRSVFKE